MMRLGAQTRRQQPSNVKGVVLVSYPNKLLIIYKKLINYVKICSQTLVSGRAGLLITLLLCYCWQLEPPQYDSAEAESK